MKALSYLVIRKFKNGFIEFLKKPSQLIITALLIAMIVISAFISGETSDYAAKRDIAELYALISAVYSLMFVLISKNGFHNGASMFTMQDVNFLFTSPFRQSTVLSFGLIQQLGRSLMLGFFILYQSGTICSTYGVSFMALVYILIGYGVTVFLSQMTAMVIYSYSCSDDKKRSVLKSVYTVIIAAFVGYILYSAYSLGEISLTTLVTAVSGTAAKLFPVGGMVALGVNGAIGGEYMNILWCLVYCAVFWVLYRIAVHFINSDYYEDVLQSAEVSFSAIAARKEGKAGENAPRNIKTGKIGFKHGKGASVIAYKHKIENRRGKVFILSPISLVLVVVSFVTCFMFRQEPATVFILSLYMMILTVASGRWAKELSYHYIFMIPDASYKKLWYMVKSDIPSIILESILCCIPVYLICNVSIAETVGLTVARISFGFLLISVNLLLQKIFGLSSKNKLIIMIYFLLVILFSLPGVAALAAIMMIMPFYSFIAFMAMALINTAVSLILGFCCRNLLETV